MRTCIVGRGEASGVDPALGPAAANFRPLLANLVCGEWSGVLVGCLRVWRRRQPPTGISVFTPSARDDRVYRLASTVPSYSIRNHQPAGGVTNTACL